MLNIKIDSYSDLYKQQVQTLILNIQQEFNIPIDLEAQPDLKEISRFYQKDNGNFWIARQGGTVIGTIALLDIGNQQAALRKMFVHKDYRGKDYQVGQSLLDELIQWARQKGLTELFLGTTEKFIAAQRFYEKNGFEEVEKGQLPASFPMVNVDVKFYKYSLSSTDLNKQL